MMRNGMWRKGGGDVRGNTISEKAMTEFIACSETYRKAELVGL
jgi:hypothetical protein